MTVDPIRFLQDTRWEDLPGRVQNQAELCVLDQIGTGIAGATTPLSAIIRDHVVAHFGGKSPVPILFDNRKTSVAGAALAGGMTIDAVDCHDGYNPVKGHIGCGLLPAVLALSDQQGGLDGQDFLTAIAIGYEIGGRLGLALHASVPDYHTSGAWVGVAASGVGARILGLSDDQTRHAMGIAEYHGPRSQMMRCIDHPTMLKDGSGWGSMAGVSAALLARDGFSGAPAITLEAPEVAGFWADLGEHWLIMDQYFKPYPVCRWAQGPIEGVLALKRTHNLTADQVDHIEVTTFHESVRLATKDPKSTEEAQYSTSYPCAAALVRGTVGLAEIDPSAFNDPEIKRLSRSMKISEDRFCNENFPEQRYARTTLHLRDGGVVTSDYLQPRWTAEDPPSEAELRGKFHLLADDIVGKDRAGRIEAALSALRTGGDLTPLQAEICVPVS
ncbi:MAG: MmgE/PrpD family protein [Rhodobacteraceae bacterium]|nr:MmgE/PrpD family protein [Paracoccaceae bacterium]